MDAVRGADLIQRHKAGLNEPIPGIHNHVVTCIASETTKCIIFHCKLELIAILWKVAVTVILTDDFKIFERKLQRHNLK